MIEMFFFFKNLEDNRENLCRKEKYGELFIHARSKDGVGLKYNKLFVVVAPLTATNNLL
jgi:hypothetical protein